MKILDYIRSFYGINKFDKRTGTILEKKYYWEVNSPGHEPIRSTIYATSLSDFHERVRLNNSYLDRKESKDLQCAINRTEVLN